MDILKWREIYEIGIEQMDEQHKQLIHLVNKMYMIIRDKKGFESLDTVLAEMSEYAQRHLQDEERLLEEHGYPGLASQQQSHHKYLEKMAELTATMENDRELAAQKIYTFLRHWWVDHIVGEDKKYGEFLREKNIH